VSEQLPEGGIELSPAEIEALDARWSSSWTPGEVARRLAGISTPWCVVAGWALDLFYGRQTRAHGDIEIAIPAAGFPEVRSRFGGYAFDAAGSGRIWADATPDVLASVFQTWHLSPASWTSSWAGRRP
jgi:aminoglycoside-2''-adenylyltransferase